MIELRKLRLEDAPFMLEWMHDDDLIKDMRADFKSKTLEDCRLFIRASQEDKKNAHFAVADIADTYVGTVSLKNIDIENKAAEFAICMRRCALGTGMAAEAMKKVIEKAFQEMKLEIVYWSVNPGSKRAVRFYNKNGYLKIRTLNEHFKQIIFRGGVQRLCSGKLLVVCKRACRLSEGNSGRKLNIDGRFPLMQSV